MYVLVNWVTVGSANGFSRLLHQGISRTNANSLPTGYKDKISMDFQNTKLFFQETTNMKNMGE